MRQWLQCVGLALGSVAVSPAGIATARAAEAASTTAASGQSAASAPLELPPTRYELTPFAGFAVGGGFKLEDAAGTGGPVGAGSGGNGGDLTDHGMFAFALDLRSDWATQYELFYGREPTDVHGDATLPRTHIVVEYLHVGGTLLLDEEALPQPYMVGGLGATRFTTTEQGDTNTRFSASLGLGLRWPVNRHLSLRLEARGFVTLVNPDSAIFCHTDQTGLLCSIRAQGQTFLQGQFLAGATFAF